jgi:diaminopimelate epimerase
MATLPFTKMQGLGNDFIVIDHLNDHLVPESATQIPITPDLARKLCDRRFGIGADQILWLTSTPSVTPVGGPAGGVDARMDILNSDGSVAEMCGNGIRAVGIYLEKRKGLAQHKLNQKERQKGQYQIETLAGIKTVQVSGSQITVDMGVARVGKEVGKKQSGIETELIQIPGQIFQFHEVDVGNPHAVIFVPDVSKVPLETWGPLLETHPRFPRQTNVEFVEVLSQQSIRVRVWERGAGATLACGTGACAAAVVQLAILQSKGTAQTELEVELPGGYLKIQWKGFSHSVMMTGPAQEVFQGVYFLE